MESTSLNEVVYDTELDTSEEKWSTLDNEIFQQIAHPNGKSDKERIDLEIDLSRVMESLPKELQHLCENLSKYSISETSRRLGIARSSIYRSIYKVRDAFEKAGLRDYL